MTNVHSKCFPRKVQKFTSGCKKPQHREYPQKKLGQPNEFRIWRFWLRNRKPSAKLRKWQAQEKRQSRVWVQSGEAAFSRLYLYLFFFPKCAMFFVNTSTCVAGVAPKCSCESELWVSEWSSSSSTPGEVKWKWMARLALYFTLLYSTLLDEVLIFLRFVFF